MDRPFLFISGDLSLDFLNTRKGSATGEPVELLPAPEWLADWFVAVGFPTVTVDDSLFAETLELREAIRTLVKSAIYSNGPAPTEALSRLNDVLATGAAWQRLTVDFKEVAEPVTPAPHPLLPVAVAARDLLTHHDHSLIRQCAGTGCVLWFLDTTKNKQRRWCRMSTCGNRMKVAAHYRRHKDDDEPA